MRNLIGLAVSSVLMAAAASAEAPGKSGAVQNTLPSAPGEIAERDLDKSDLAQAYQAVNEAYDIQWEQGGIEDTQNKLKTLQNKVGEKVYTVAKLALKHCKGNLVTARLYFLALCKSAETAAENRYVKENKEEKPIGQLIPLWATYKSALSKGLESGLDPNMVIEGDPKNSPKYATAAQYRAAVQDLRAGTGSQAGNERNANSAVAQLQVVTSGMSPTLQASLAVLMEGLRRLTHTEQDVIAPRVLALGEEVTKMASENEKKALASKPETSDDSGADMDVGTKAALQKALDDESAKGETKGGRKTKVRAA